MSGSLQDRVTIVTGAGSGIGKAIAQLFHSQGAKLVLADVSGEEQALAAALGDRTVGLRVDVSRETDVKSMIDTALARFGGLDILCNVAGVDGDLAPLADQTGESFERVIGVNLRGVFLGMKYAIPHMLARGKGAIVNVSSAAGLVAMPAMSIYGASKAGVIQLTKSAALEYAAHGVRVNAICPGAIDTPMIQKIRAIHPEAESRAKAATPMGRIGRPEEIATAALFLASDHASFVTGVALPVDGGYTLP